MPSKKRKKDWGNDLILPLSDRADCMWCMTFLYFCAVKHRLYINIIDIYVAVFSSFHQ